MTPRTIRHTRTLEYCDGIQLFEAKDAIGGNYLALLVELCTEGDRYLVVGCEPDALRLFRSGGTDLRQLLENSTQYGWYLADVVNISEPIGLCPQEGDAIPDKFLPETGFHLDQAPVDNELVAEAHDKNRVMIQFRIEPPGSADDHAVPAPILGGFINLIQNLTRYAVLHITKTEGRSPSRGAAGRDAHVLDAVALVPGSVIVKFQGAYSPDLFGRSRLTESLEHLDKLFAAATSPFEARSVLEPYKGHMAGAYIKLLRFLDEHQTGISYTWAAPRSQRLSHHNVPLHQISDLASTLTAATDLESEQVIVEGVLEMADGPNKRWRMRTAEGTRTGVVADDGPSLSQLVIDETYRFECTEDIEIVDASLRERHTLYVQSISRFDPHG